MKTTSIALALGLFALSSLAGAQKATPSATRFARVLMPDDDVPELTLAPIDRDAVRAEDLQREADGLPPRYAIPNLVRLSPFADGALELVDGDTIVWRLRVRAPGAESINLGFGRYRMTAGGSLLIYSRDRMQVLRPFTARDNEAHGELWTPIVRGDEVVLELTLPAEEFDDGRLALELSQVGYGYRGFGGKDGDGADSGSCNVDVVCPDGDAWREEIPAVGVISTGGSTFCTGFMVNNTANDRTPFFMTANHCGIGAGNAPSLVVYWNYETSVCGGTPDGTLDEFNTGSVHLASFAASDFTLVQLDDDPNSEWGVTFAGWDRSGVDPAGAIAIHHPNTDEKAISFEFDPTSTTTYLNTAVPGDGTHIRITDWDIGTTEPGSSGSPLFDPDHRIVGQLHGGYAACGNNSSDWYGRFSRSWTGGGTPSTRLSDWLDPVGSGAMTVDTLGNGLSVSPSGDVAHDGPVGGPFSNASTVYTLSNTTEAAISYSVSLTDGTAFALDGGPGPVAGVLASMDTVDVTVSVASAADALASGVYAETVVFDDFTNGIQFTRDHELEVGRRTIYSFDLSTDPGWTTEGDWEYGVPLGGGGLGGGFPDPTSGATGANVYGYNLAGDYPNNLSEQHLVSTAINCTGATGVKVRYKRWLNADKGANDHAFFRVSNDGVVFGRVWSNPVAVTDSSWVQQEFDISAIADGEPTVYLRWTMGVTDGSSTYSGWNVDDIEISAVAPVAFQEYGAGLAGSGGFVPTLSGSGDTSTNSVFNLNLADGLGGAPTVLLFGLIPDQVPLFGGDVLVNNIAITLSRVLSGPAGVPGAGSLGLNVAFVDPSLVGVSLYVQAVVADSSTPEGLSLTNGLHLFADY